jgi:Transglutaminase-like superfamily
MDASSVVAPPASSTGPVSTGTVHRHRLAFEFINRQTTPLDVWMVVPASTPNQRVVEQAWTHRQPEQINRAEMNELAFATVQPGETFGFTATIALSDASVAAGALSEEERIWYLRSTGMIEVNDAVRELAGRVVDGAAAPDEQAKRLYLYIVAEYSYEWPPASRGSEEIRRTRCGDCGEYSHLYAALCRALGIPCRVIYGTWASGETEAHAWNEVHLPQRGWVVVDTSGDQLSVTGWLVRKSILPARTLLRHWGRPPADRIGFSIDPEALLVPAYTEPALPLPADDSVERMHLAGRLVAWGQESMGGRAPYLQPMYLRQQRFEPWVQAQEPTGRWRVSRIAGIMDYMRTALVTLVFLTLIVRWLT